MTDQSPGSRNRDELRLSIVGDVVFGGADSPVAVCTLGSRSLLAGLAGRPEIAIAGRVFTENVGVERMIQNLVGFKTARFLVVCGRETSHLVGETILALHRHGLDDSGRVVGSAAPEPVMPNLRAEHLRAFQERITVVDMIGVTDVEAIVAQARTLVTSPETPPGLRAADRSADAAPLDATVISASRDPASSWEYDPVGYFVIFVDRGRRLLRAEHHSPEHRLVQVFEGRRAEDLSHTIVRHGAVTLLAHAAYLGRELARAETALALGLDYDQDRPLSGAAALGSTQTGEQMEETSGDRSGDSGAS